MNTFLHILSFIGSLGLFLYGMKIMSEGLEKLAGDHMRNILGAMTRNRFMGVLTGVGVTALIQSSSATTVMVVSFVNAGLMTLRQAIGVIMGANIGTTVTAWIISLIGFKVSISALSLPLLAIALPLFFAGKGKTKNWGEFIFGFAFLFMGLNLLSKAAESLEIGTHMAGWLSHLPCDRFWTIPLFVLMGTVMTMLMQVKLTMPFLLPCLPTYLAPKAAKKMDGTMLITDRIVPRPILPMIMPPRIVLMMAWLPTC